MLLWDFVAFYGLIDNLYYHIQGDMALYGMFVMGFK